MDNSISLNRDNNTEKSVMNLLQLIKSDLKQIKLDKRDITMIFGNTGSGKTVLSAYLSGIKLKVEVDDNDDFRLVYNQQQQLKQQNKISASGIRSETILPQLFCGEKLDFIDTPGFMNSRGDEIEIANSFFLNKVIEQATQIKLILLIDGTSLNSQGYGDSQGAAIKSIFQTFYSIVKDSKEDISSYTVLVISKTIMSRSFSYYENKIKKFLDELMESDDFLSQTSQKCGNTYESAKNFLKEMQRCQILNFSSPTQNNNSIYDQSYRKDMLIKLEQASFSNTLSLKFPIPINSLSRIEYLWLYSQSMISESFVNLGRILQQIINHFNLSQLLSTERMIIKASQIQIICDSEYMNLINNLFLFPFQKEFELQISSWGQYENIQPFKNFNFSISFYLNEIHQVILSKIEMRSVFFSIKQTHQFFNELLTHIEKCKQDFYWKQKLDSLNQQFVQQKQEVGKLEQQMTIKKDDTSTLKQDNNKQQQQADLLLTQQNQPNSEQIKKIINNNQQSQQQQKQLKDLKNNKIEEKMKKPNKGNEKSKQQTKKLSTKQRQPYQYQYSHYKNSSSNNNDYLDNFIYNVQEDPSILSDIFDFDKW